jgi:hypothetical protein
MRWQSSRDGGDGDLICSALIQIAHSPLERQGDVGLPPLLLHSILLRLDGSHRASESASRPSELEGSCTYAEQNRGAVRDPLKCPPHDPAVAPSSLESNSF